eukprot:COSAG06_NODE_3774_length_4919_cov_10.651660_4_plen_132_part_00
MYYITSCLYDHQLSIRLSVQALSVARGPLCLPTSPSAALSIDWLSPASLPRVFRGGRKQHRCPCPAAAQGGSEWCWPQLLIQVVRRAHGLLAELLSHGRPEQEAHAAFRSASCHAQRDTFGLVEGLECRGQ